MEAFSNIPNHLVSNSAAAINATDDASTADPDESVLNLAMTKGPTRRRHDDDESDIFDDSASLVSTQIDGPGPRPVEEDKELPPHACA